MPGGLVLFGALGCGCLPRQRDAHCAAPFVEHVQHVSFAELDPDRPPATVPGVVPLQVSVDAPVDDLQRHALIAPRTDGFERRTDDANEVPFVPAAQIRLNRPAVFVGRHRRATDHVRIVIPDHGIQFTFALRPSSIRSIAPHRR